MTEQTPSHRKAGRPPRKCVTTQNVAGDTQAETKPAKTSKPKPSQEDN